jgi:hypothetical protein
MAVSIELLEPISRVAGQLICDMRVEIAPARCQLSFVRPKSRERPRRCARCARIPRALPDGPTCPPGNYRLKIRDRDYQSTDYRFTLQKGGSPEPLEILVAPLPQYPPVPQVRSGSIPVYPTGALAAGIQGVVHLRLSFTGDRVIDVDADSDYPQLAAAAAANVRTWRFQTTTVPVVSHHVLRTASIKAIASSPWRHRRHAATVVCNDPAVRPCERGISSPPETVLRRALHCFTVNQEQ